MKILFLSGLLSYGGASKLIFDMLPRMKAKGNICELLVLSGKESKYINDLCQQGILVHIIPSDIRGHLKKIKYIMNWISSRNYDVIHVNLFPTIYYCSIVKVLLGRKCPPMVMTEHSTDNRRRHKPFLRPVEKFIYKKYDYIISISEQTQEKLCTWLKQKNRLKFTVIENGIDVKSFKNAKAISPNALYSQYCCDDILLLTVGSFTPQKNHKILIEALAHLPDRFKLILAGEGPLENEIRAQIKNLNLENRVVFLGFRRDIPEIMHTADILVIPSLWEGFGLIAVEAMACGLPIVASNVPGLAEVIGECGIKFDPRSTQDIIKSILFMQNKQMQREYVNLAYNKVDRYDISNTVTEYLKIYNTFKVSDK